MSFFRIFLSVILSAVTMVSLTGCGSLLRQAVNHKFPPVSPGLRQLGAIQAQEKSLSTLTTPSAYGFLSGAEISNYFETLLSHPFPLDKNASAYLASAPVLTGARLAFGKQEVALSADFFIAFTGQHKNIDLDNISVSGNLDIRLYPELVPSSDPSIAAAVRLRPAISSVQICKLDLSKSSHKAFYWFERRAVLSTVLNDALVAFRDNINGQVHADLPIPLGPLKIGRDAGDSGDGVVISPATLAAIRPQFAAGVVEVSPKGLVVLADARLDVLDPSKLPPSQTPQPLPPESLPKVAPANVINTEFSTFEKSVNKAISNNFGTVSEMSNEVAIKKRLLSSTINTVFDSKQIQIAYTGPLDEYGPKSDDDRNLHLPDKPNLHCDQLVNLSCDPRGSCVPFLVKQAQQKKGVADKACSDANSAIQSAAGTINKACNIGPCIHLGPLGNVCPVDVVAPGLCGSAKATLAVNHAALAVCQGTVDFTAKYLSAPQDITDDLTQKLGLGSLYSTVCTQYDKFLNGPQCLATKAAWDLSCGTVQATLDTLIHGQVFATLDWSVKGPGNDAIKLTASLNKIHVTNALDRVDISNLSASGSVTAEGWAKFTPKPEFFPICPPPPCLPGHDCRITLNPTTVNASLTDDHLGGAFGLASFPADGYPNGRNGFFIAPDSFKVDVTLNTSPIAKLIRGNALQMPCILNGVTWTGYAVAEVVSLTGFDIKIPHTFDLNRKRIGWADSQVEIPLSWKDVNGGIQVAEKLKLPIDFSVTDDLLVAQAGKIPEPTNILPPAVYRRPTLLELAAGVGTGFVVTSRETSQQSNTFWSPVVPYIAMNYKVPYVGLFGAAIPGPKASDFAAGVGIASRPFKNVDRLSLLMGARVGPSTSHLQDGPHFMFAIGWDIGRLALRGCERCN